LFVGVSGITPAKGDLAIGKGDQPMVGNGRAMGVAAEILQHIFGATEGAFQVDHPILSIERPQPGGEGFGSCKQLYGYQNSSCLVLALLLGDLNRLFRLLWF
jgi:hypothetical protein